MVHIAHDTTLNILGRMTAHAHVHNGCAMEFLAVPLTGFVSSIYVSGSINFAYPANQALTLAKPSSVTVDSASMTHIDCRTFEIQEGAELHILNETNLFHLETDEFKVDGSFSAKELNISSKIKKFMVGYKGQVSFDPVSTDMYIGPYIDIRGQVALNKYVSIVYPCNQFLLETGTLTWPATSDVITIECSIVKINSAFNPGIITTGDGIDQFTVGASGTFTLTADGPIWLHTVSISGKMYVINTAILESHKSSDRRIEEVHIHSPNGLLQLNSNNLPARNNSVPTSQSCNILKVKSLTIDKTFNAKDLEVDTGIDDITVNSYGSWSFGPCDTFQVSEIYINGTVVSYYPLTLVGKSRDKVESIKIDIGGTMTLDSVNQNTRKWNDVSIIGVHNFDIYGSVKAGLLKNYVSASEGWDRLNIFEKGYFSFHSHDQMMIDYMYIFGQFECYSNVSMNGSDTDLIIHIGPSGIMKFDSLITSKWKDQSAVIASRVQMDSGSYWQSGNTQWTVDEAIISGNLYSYPFPDALILHFTIKNGGLVDFSRTSVVKGLDVTVEAGGTFDIEFQHTPDDTSRALSESKLLYKSVIIRGMARAGALYIGHLAENMQLCETVAIFGTLDVSGGGYMYDAGPG